MKTTRLIGVAAALLLHASAFAAAATTAPPDAGSLMQQQQPQRQQVPDRVPARDERPAASTADERVRVVVREFRFVGAEGEVSREKLHKLVRPLIGTTFTESSLQALTERITRYLQKDGWFLAKAFCPEQDVTGGIVTIEVVIGKSDGQIAYHRNGKVRVRQSLLDAIGRNAVSNGQPLRSDLLERSLLLMGGLPGVTAKGNLEAGAVSGTSKVNVDVQEGRLVTGSLSGDNLGNRFTGIYRATGNLSFNDPFGYGDLLSLLWMQSERVYQGQASYTFPILSSGLRGAVGFTGMHYSIGQEFAAYNFDGSSSTTEASLGYPLVLSQQGSVALLVKYRYRDFEDRYMAGLPLSKGNSGSVTVSLNGDRYDGMFGLSGYNVWSVSMTAGDLDRQNYSGSRHYAALVNGGYSRLNLGYTRVQRLSIPGILQFAMNGQLASTNLDSSEKLALGGPYGIRAYPLGEASGDQGSLINTELHWPLPAPATWGRMQAVLFYDVGYIELQKSQNQSPGNASNRNAYWLQGAGLGLNYELSSRFRLQATWAHALGDNPGRTTAGNNADGEKDKSRFWLTSVFYF